MEAQLNAIGIVWQPPDGAPQSCIADSPEWYEWLARPESERLLFVHPHHGRFILRHERKQRGSWYWSIYYRSDGRLRKAYLGKGSQLSLHRIQAAAHALATGGAPPDASGTLVDLPVRPPLLPAKLAPPPPRSHAVPRSHLMAQLSRAVERPVTLVVAPAGSGKTTLLAAWLRQNEAARTKDEHSSKADHPSSFLLPPSHVAWLSLDAHDNDPARFLTYLWAAFEDLPLATAVLSQRWLQPPQPLALQAELTLLLHAIGALDAPVLLVLDDFHHITNLDLHEAMRFVIDHQPPNLRLVIAGRSEPPLAVGRLRANGHLSELRGSDLRFSADETHHFLVHTMGLAASRSEAEVLEQRTEGWAAGLYLAALVALRHGGLRALAHVTGSQHEIVDYLATEVIADQPADVQQFLLFTSILDRLHAPLCDALVYNRIDSVAKRTGELSLGSLPSSHAIIDQLDRANLFLVPLDGEGRWYRYHQLFGDFLRDRLERTAPDLLPELHRRAANWYATQGFMTEAVGHALRADSMLAATLIERYGRTLLMRGAVTTVLGWIERLPSELLASRLDLALTAAWALTAAGRLDVASLHLDNVETLLGAADNEQALTGELLAVRAAIAGLRRNLAATAALCEAALVRLTPQQGYIRSVVLQLLGGTAYASGDANGASRALSEAVRLSQASGNLYITAFSTRQLADVRVMQGQLSEAARLYHQVLDGDGGASASLISVAGMAAVGLGELRYLHNDLPTAAHLIERGLAVGEQGHDVEIIVRGSLALARIRTAENDSGTARTLLERAAQVANSGTTWLYDWVQSELARCATLAGDIATGSAWVQNCGLSLDDTPSYLYENHYLTLARVAIARATAEDGLATLRAVSQLLQRMWDEAERSGRISSQVEIGALMAQALHGAGMAEAAGAALLQALERGDPNDYIRIYLDGGAAIHALLRRLLRGGLPPELRASVTALQRAFVTPVAGELPDGPELLSPREMEVLQLLAAGRTNQQIAQSLVLSVGTIKKHLNNLYGKLGASSRTEAVARARQLGVPL